MGIGSGDGSPIARKHDKYLYGKNKMKRIFVDTGAWYAFVDKKILITFMLKNYMIITLCHL